MKCVARLRLGRASYCVFSLFMVLPWIPAVVPSNRDVEICVNSFRLHMEHLVGEINILDGYLLFEDTVLVLGSLCVTTEG